MAVVINEFEVVPGAGDSSQRDAAPPSGDAGESPLPSPRDIERLIEQRLQRVERVWAH